MLKGTHQPSPVQVAEYEESNRNILRCGAHVAHSCASNDYSLSSLDSVFRIRILRADVYGADDRFGAYDH